MRIKAGLTKLRAPWVCTLALLALGACSREDNSPHKWTEFETVAGQAFPVPKHWLATPNGRLTHNLKLPDSVPKPVPFNFTRAKLRALNPFTPSVSEQYWRHLCATEAGQYIFKTVKPVEGLAFMRIATVPLKHQDEADVDNWMYEGSFVEIYLNQEDPPEYRAARFISWPIRPYHTVEIPNSNGSKWMRFTRLRDEPIGGRLREAVSDGYWQGVPLEMPTERYAVTWRGLVRPQDRQHRIAGIEMIVFDRQSEQVLSVIRTFQHGRRTWRNAAGCPEMYSHFADPANIPEVLLAARTLQPIRPSVFLQSNDEAVSRRKMK